MIRLLILCLVVFARVPLSRAINRHESPHRVEDNLLEWTLFLLILRIHRIQLLVAYDGPRVSGTTSFMGGICKRENISISVLGIL